MRQRGQLLTSFPDVPLPPTPSLSASGLKLAEFIEERGNSSRHISTICIWGCLPQWMLMREPGASDSPYWGLGGKNTPFWSGGRIDLPSPR